jgi:hypothetical protein
MWLEKGLILIVQLVYTRFVMRKTEAALLLLILFVFELGTPSSSWIKASH